MLAVVVDEAVLGVAGTAAVVVVGVLTTAVAVVASVSCCSVDATLSTSTAGGGDGDAIAGSWFSLVDCNATAAVVLCTVSEVDISFVKFRRKVYSMNKREDSFPSTNYSS